MVGKAEVKEEDVKSMILPNDAMFHLTPLSTRQNQNFELRHTFQEFYRKKAIAIASERVSCSSKQHRAKKALETRAKLVRTAHVA